MKDEGTYSRLHICLWLVDFTCIGTYDLGWTIYHRPILLVLLKHLHVLSLLKRSPRCFSKVQSIKFELKSQRNEEAELRQVGFSTDQTQPAFRSISVWVSVVSACADLHTSKQLSTHKAFLPPVCDPRQFNLQFANVKMMRLKATYLKGPSFYATTLQWDDNPGVNWVEGHTAHTQHQILLAL